MDLFSGHGITETRITDSLWFTTGYSYTTLQNDLSGTRIFGPIFDSAFGEPLPTLGSRDHAFIDLAGTAQDKEHVANANLFWMPLRKPRGFSRFPIYPSELGDRFDFSRGGTCAKHATVYPNESGATDSTSDLEYRHLAQRRQITTVSPSGWSCVTPVSKIGFSISKANGKRNGATSMSFRR